MPSQRFSLFSHKDYFSFTVLLLVMLGGSFTEILSLGAIPIFVSLVTAPEQNQDMQRIFSSLIHRLNLPQADNLILWGGVCLGIFFLIRTLYLIASFALQQRILQNRRIELSSRLFKAYMDAPYAYHLAHNSSTFIENVINEAERVISYCVDTLLNIIRNCIILVTVIALLMTYDPVISLGVFSILALTAGSFMFLSRKKMRELGNTMYQQRIAAIKNATEGINAYTEAQILDRKDIFHKRLHLALEKLGNKNKIHALITCSTWPIMELITCLVLLGTMGVMALDNPDTTSIAPTIALVTVALARLKGTVTEIMIHVSQLRSNTSIVQALASDLKELERPGETVKPDPQVQFKQELELKNISFTYERAKQETLHHISFSVPVGNSVALVGPTGSGKSTIAYLIAALLEPNEGTITVDQTVLRTPQQIRAWQNMIGFVPQDICLVDDTIMANVAFGLPTEEIDQQLLEEAIDAAQLKDFIQSLPDGFMTIVGERGVRLSGGQKQRIAIARALYRKPPFILFDEATSALDVTTEKEVVQALNNLHGNHTVVVIAHRLSTVKHCDQIIFIKQGTIMGKGTFQELLETLPDFKAMATLQ